MGVDGGSDGACAQTIKERCSEIGDGGEEDDLGGVGKRGWNRDDRKDGDHEAEERGGEAKGRGET